MRRRLILGLLVGAIAINGIAGCSARETLLAIFHAGPPAAAAGAKGFATGGPVGGIVAFVSSLLLAGGARHVERRKMKRSHTTERAADRARIAELERRLALLSQHPPGA